MRAPEAKLVEGSLQAASCSVVAAPHHPTEPGKYARSTTRKQPSCAKCSINVYACARRRDRGGTVCSSKLRREIGLIDNAVVNWVRQRVLTDSYVAEVIAEVRRRIEARAATNEADRDELERQAKKLREHLDKFAELALDAPTDTRSVSFTKMSDRQTQLRAIESGEVAHEDQYGPRTWSNFSFTSLCNARSMNARWSAGPASMTRNTRMASRRDRAEAIVRNYAILALGCGLMPTPLLDVAALTLIEVRMLEELAALYELPISRVRAESQVSALIGSLTATTLGFRPLMAGRYAFARYMMPVTGILLAAASVSAASASITYAIGRIFINDFESDGPITKLEVDAKQTKTMVQPAPSPAPLPSVAPTSNPAPSPTPMFEVSVPDDIRIVKGIGPKICELLKSKGITTFAELAATPIATLQRILNEAGKGYSHHDPTTWPAQAQLLAAGKAMPLDAT